MCESKVVLRRDGAEEELMDDVAYMKVSEGGVELVRIDGVRRTLSNVVIDEIDFINHKVFLRSSSPGD